MRPAATAGRMRGSWRCRLSLSSVRRLHHQYPYPYPHLHLYARVHLRLLQQLPPPLHGNQLSLRTRKTLLLLLLQLVRASRTAGRL